MIDLVLEGVVYAVAQAGVDKVDAPGSPPSVDLTPLIDALAELKVQGAEVVSALTQPTRTAGDELCERAVTAFGKGWYEDARRDALASIDTYPYRGRPHLIGALAALALGDGAEALRLLDSAVKYAANGEPEVGAMAALLGADLASAVGGHNFAVDLLQRADRLMEGRCPALVAALVRLKGRDGDVAERLRQLWWDEYGSVLKRAVDTDLVKGLSVSLPDTSYEYMLAGESFGTYLQQVSTALLHASIPRMRLNQQLQRFKAGRRIYVFSLRMKKALQLAGVDLPFWAFTVGDVLAQCRKLKGAPEWPGDALWKSPPVDDLEDLGRVFRYAEGSARLLQRCLSNLPRLASDDSSLSLDERSAVSAALPLVPSWEVALNSIIAESNVALIDQAQATYEQYATNSRSSSAMDVIHLGKIPSSLLKPLGGVPELPSA